MAGAGIFRYGGFWIRLVAYTVDCLLLTFAAAIIGGLTGLDFFSTDPEKFDWTANGINVVGSWLYEALMTSSARGATVGKMVVGLSVVTDRGERLSFLNATGRYLAKIISALILCIGFIMVAFTDKKRGLHDMIAGTLVVRTTD
jgi:uncharacterized RDD family membrane protein YckC